MKFTITLLALLLTQISIHSPDAKAQANLEYPGGPTSRMNADDIAALGTWASNVDHELSRLKRNVEFETDDQLIRDKLYKRMKQIAGESGLRPGDLLLRQSLYTGIILCDIIQKEGIDKGATVGVVGLQAKILLNSLDLARDYYISDYAYVNGLLVNREAVRFNDKLVEFGVRLAKFIYKESTTVQGLDASASYGMIRWSLGVLNVKLLEDSRNVAYASTIKYLNDSLSEYPDMAELANDQEATFKIVGLKRLAKEVFAEIKATTDSLSRD